MEDGLEGPQVLGCKLEKRIKFVLQIFPTSEKDSIFTIEKKKKNQEEKRSILNDI